MSNTFARRIAIIEVLCVRRYDKISNLAFEFGVSSHTVRRDLKVLSQMFPVYTIQGTGGGVRVVDGYRFGNKYLNSEQTEFLERITKSLSIKDSVMMRSIINKFRLPEK